MTESIQVGQTVPEFVMDTFEPERGEFGELRLSKQRAQGRWTILFFYPADFTFVCATEFAALARRDAELRALGGDVVTVSCDTKYTHLAWQQHEGELESVRYPMAADPTGEVARLFGVYLADQGVALRGTFIVDPQGTLMNAEVNFLNLGRNVDELLRKFKANVYLASAPEEVCPAEWKEEGDVTLTPGAEMVGRVHEALSQGGRAPGREGR